MDYFQEGEVSDLNLQRAVSELQKFNNIQYLIYFWKAVGPWRSSDIPWPEKCSTHWTKDLDLT